MRQRLTLSLPGLTRQSIPLRKKMDARVKPARDELPPFESCGAVAWPLAARAQQPMTTSQRAARGAQAHGVRPIGRCSRLSAMFPTAME